MAAALMSDNMHPFPDSPTEETAYPCKGCGEILEEGKAFELAGNRWHIDCFRCNTCNTLLNSDANLLLLGDGSLICNNCTYSCSSCGNKIEDLAILTGDHAYCANCFKCRNCKRKIENLRYARTSQGIFCMDCHEALMARRRKKTAKSGASKKSNIDKSLPAIPPVDSAARKTAYIPADQDLDYASQNMANMPELPSVRMSVNDFRHELATEGTTSSSSHQPQASLTLPQTSYRRDQRSSYQSAQSELSATNEEFLIPLAFDPTSKPNIASSPPRSPPRVTNDRNSRADRELGHSPSISQSVNAQATIPDVMSTIVNSVTHSRKDSSLASGSGVPLTTSALTDQPEASQTTQLSRQESSRGDKQFKLQEAPRTRNDLSQNSTPRMGVSGAAHQRSPSTREQLPDTRTSPRLDYEMSPAFSDGFDSPRQLPDAAEVLRNVPKRGDSLEQRQQAIPRKEVSGPLNDTSNSTRPAEGLPPALKLNGNAAISRPVATPGSGSLFDGPDSTATSMVTSDKFVQPRAPPAPPSSHDRSRNVSISTLQSEAQKSPGLPQYSGQGDFTLEEDISRILNFDEPAAHESFLRRVSNSVRHGRSYSDKSGRFGRERWPKSPTVANIGAGYEISSPSQTSPESREELAWFKNELRRERLKNAEREKKIAELQSQISTATNINQVDTELKEKRSTMTLLDTQKEMVVRELEVLTEHLAEINKTGEPLDMARMNTRVLRDFAESLEKLKQSFAPQIESLVQQRNGLLQEITNLTQTKDKSFQEFEQLSIKNAQLAEFNNQLVDQIQNIYKDNRGPGMENLGQPNGLGIYQPSHGKDASKTSFDSRDITKPSLMSAPSNSSETIVAPYETEGPPTIQSFGAAQVVDVKKANAAKRFDWRKGQKMAKGVAKGVKGAFASAQQNYGRDMQFTETGAYVDSQTQGGAEYGQLRPDGPEPSRQHPSSTGSGGWFSSNQNRDASTNLKPSNKTGLYSQSANISTPSLSRLTVTPLFGTDLTVRLSHEGTSIPAIVTRCVSEVEHRGMDVEGIYRKSGGNSAVTLVKDGFERASAPTYSFEDISDPDLDIHAVTSGLKQYFRKLPVPLITFETYDSIIEIPRLPEAERTSVLREALKELPRGHYDTLEFLMVHLGKVVELERENLMTAMNVAVVFAPTIMRPESVARELNDTKSKNEVVMWMVVHCREVFAKDPTLIV